MSTRTVAETEANIKAIQDVNPDWARWAEILDIMNKILTEENNFTGEQYFTLIP